MSLLEEWRSVAYDYTKSKEEVDIFWKDYFIKEEQFYNKLLNISEHPILDTVENFANKFNVDIITMTGFLDGINDSLKIPNNIENMTEKTIITLDYDAKVLYENAVKSNAKHIYNLSIWDKILPNRNNEAQSNKNHYVENNTVINIPKCPICQSTNLKKISGWSKSMSTMVWGVFAAGRVSKTWHCNNCDSEW